MAAYITPLMINIEHVDKIDHYYGKTTITITWKGGGKDIFDTTLRPVAFFPFKKFGYDPKLKFKRK